jgi:hypothetical protein
VTPHEPPPRMMQADLTEPADTYHAREHAEVDGCRVSRHPCQPVDPAPEFEAEVWSVILDRSGIVWVNCHGDFIRANNGNGIRGLTIAAYCEDRAEAEMSVESYQRTGRLTCHLLHSDPIFQGKLLPYAIAVKVVGAKP